MKCSDPACHAKASRELLGVAMCEAYYIEALEHSAHIVANAYLVELSELSRTDRERDEKRSATMEQKRNAKYITFNQWIEQEQSPQAEAPPCPKD